MELDTKDYVEPSIQYMFLVFVQEMNSVVNEAEEKYNHEKDEDLVKEDPGFRPECMEMYCKAGQSKRVWGELYKVS